jgi:hypothetical protein
MHSEVSHGSLRSGFRHFARFWVLAFACSARHAVRYAARYQVHQYVVCRYLARVELLYARWPHPHLLPLLIHQSSKGSNCKYKNLSYSTYLLGHSFLSARHHMMANVCTNILQRRQYIIHMYHKKYGQFDLRLSPNNYICFLGRKCVSPVSKPALTG